MKPLLFSSFLFLLSCSNSDSRKSVETSSIDTSYSWTIFNSNPKQFECGTSELLRNEAERSGLKNPVNFKEVSFITTKTKFRYLIKIIKEDSLYFSAFNTKGLRDFYIPNLQDSIWLTLPFSELSCIKKGITDSFPIKISYAVDIDKLFNVTLSTDSTIANRLIKIIDINKIGSIVATN